MTISDYERTRISESYKMLIYNIELWPTKTDIKVKNGPGWLSLRIWKSIVNKKMGWILEIAAYEKMDSEAEISMNLCYGNTDTLYRFMLRELSDKCDHTYFLATLVCMKVTQEAEFGMGIL